MSCKALQVAWHFSFGLEQDGEGLVSVEQANEFMDAIISLAEPRGLLVGGGYSEYEDVPHSKFQLRREWGSMMLNHVFKPTAEEVARIIRTPSRGGGLTRH